MKEDPKDTVVKKVSVRQLRKEQPLFDINPRIAWEFLNRAKSWDRSAAVIFQAEGEQFTPWKDEDEVHSPDAPPVAPTSFVEALRSKLQDSAPPDGAAKGLPRA